jgi:hypothetical protein
VGKGQMAGLACARASQSLSRLPRRGTTAPRLHLAAAAEARKQRQRRRMRFSLHAVRVACFAGAGLSLLAATRVRSPVAGLLCSTSFLSPPPHAPT